MYRKLRRAETDSMPIEVRLATLSSPANALFSGHAKALEEAANQAIRLGRMPGGRTKE
jgi:hypothetical protein